MAPPRPFTPADGGARRPPGPWLAYRVRVPAVDLPRSVLLALWLGARRAAPGAAALAVQADDEPHLVQTAGGTVPLAAWLTSAAPDELSAPLPAPGEPGPVGPPHAGEVAAAGEALLMCTAGRCEVLWPQVTRFGSALEPGHQVVWHVAPVPDWRGAVLAQVGLRGEAERALRDGLRDATQALVDLDVARWRPDVAEDLAALRDGVPAAGRLPAGLDGPRLRVLAQAARLRAIVALARQDAGGAVTVFATDQRSTALREVDRAARRALTAAATWCGPTARGPA